MKAFTLAEVLIVLAIILALSAVGWPLIGNWSFNAQTNNAKSEMVQIIRLARERSLAGFKNQTHGIKLMSDGYVLFQGDSYQTRQDQYDLEIKLHKGLVISYQLAGIGPSADEVVFDGFGYPSRWGSITISAGETQSIIGLKQTGMVE